MAMDSSAYSATERRGVMAIFSRIEMRAIIHPEKWPVAALAKRLQRSRNYGGTRNEWILGVAFSAHLQSGAERAYFQTDFFFEVVTSGMAW